jgi:predicted dehydrogenase
MMREFLNSIENDAPPPVPLEEGVKFVTLIEAIKKSISEKSDVNV